MEEVVEVSDLEAHLGYWLRLVSNRVSGGFARALEAYGYTAAEWVVLRLLYNSADTPAAELAETMGMTRGAVSKIISKLETKCLVQRSTRQDDRRSQVLLLSEAAHQEVTLLSQLADQNDQHFFGCLDLPQQQVLRDLLKQLVKAHQITEVPID